jgi:hypothetical protein
MPTNSKGIIMTRKEKALLQVDNREYEYGIETQYTNGTWAGCCPLFIDCGDDDCEDPTKIGNYGSITGCRGITCVECWNKDV